MQLAKNFLYSTFLGLFAATLVCQQPATALADESGIAASAAAITPLRAGDPAPAFELRTVNDQAWRFEPDRLERPTVLISFRGGWCPYCNLHLSELRHVIPDLRADGFDVLFLSGDAPAQLYAGLQQETQQDIDGLDYTILSDAGIEAALAFGTAFRTGEGLNDYLDEKAYDYAGSSIARYSALSVPYVYIVDTSGTIVFDFVEPDYKVRLPADKLMKAAAAAR
ncbi:MAG: redoxin domain-containing protein [Gammaproteobacteria bacterium]|nr:redoxin domain-containing protein [Gammaproteobacteria bacterium]MDH4255035.1 redoxin domain-containing protein [Gammaproteobacteria bacterium]MDH5309264.1 redoxin domain-containing protein [Gammaproteobacteria bacterium]